MPFNSLFILLLTIFAWWHFLLNDIFDHCSFFESVLPLVASIQCQDNVIQLVVHPSCIELHGIIVLFWFAHKDGNSWYIFAQTFKLNIQPQLVFSCIDRWRKLDGIYVVFECVQMSLVKLTSLNSCHSFLNIFLHWLDLVHRLCMFEPFCWHFTPFFQWIYFLWRLLFRRTIVKQFSLRLFRWFLINTKRKLINLIYFRFSLCRNLLSSTGPFPSRARMTPIIWWWCWFPILI